MDNIFNNIETIDNIGTYCTVSRNINTGEVIISSQQLYKSIKDNQDIIVDTSRNVYIFCGTQYRKVNKVEVEHAIKSLLPVDYRKKTHWKAVKDEIMSDYSGVKETDFNSDENIIAFSNGVLDLRTKELKPHNKEYLISRVVDAPYVKNCDDLKAPVFFKFLDELVSGDEGKKKCILEFMGAVLSNAKGWRYKKALLMTGKGNTGKSKMRELVTKLIGEDYCIPMDLKQLNERFGPANLYCKRLTGSGDMSYVRIDEMAIFKELTGGDMITAEFKNKDAFTFRYDGFIWCNCNSLPTFGGDKGEHVYDRFMVIDCNNVIPKEKRDANLLEKLYKEKDAIINYCIKYFIESRERSYEFTESESMVINRQKYMEENNSLFMFIRERCQIDDKSKVLRSTFNKEYRAWCMDNDVRQEPSKDVASMLYEKNGIVAKKTDGIFHYRGLMLYSKDAGEY